MPGETTTGSDVIGSVANGSGNDILATLVGEGRKYKTVDDLAKSRIEADSFIDKIKGENQTLRDLLKELTKQEDEQAIEARLVAKRAKEEPVNQSSTPNKANGQPGATFDKSAVYEAVREYSKDERETTNQNRTNQILAEMFGDKAVVEVAARAKQKGVTGDVLKSVARTSPDAFFAMLGIEVTQESAGTKQGSFAGKGSHNADANAGNGAKSDVRNQSYYDKLKTEMGVRKFVLDRALQLQMHKDMQAQGDSFFS